ncbi:MAG: ExeM/NucH family extracellular endonuclease [Aquabacterium sp.]|nr:ExeM/NucH family extracellular endonuclease [Aquabacterium sp.]
MPTLPLIRATALAAATLLLHLHAQAQALPAACSQPAMPISQVQGSSDVSPLAGSTVTVQGVVVGDFEGASPALRGFYLQSLVGDADPATSEGLFVFNANNNAVAVGQVVRVTGAVAEFQGQTQITPTSPAMVIACGSGSVGPTDVLLPFSTAAFAERYEGMLVRLPQTLSVTEHFQLGRFGQVVLSVDGRQQRPTNVVTPGAAAVALEAANQLGRIILDDALQSQNPDPIVFGRNGQPLAAGNTLRGGDTTSGIVGVMTFTWAGNAASGNAWRVRPIGALGGSVPVFQASNPRPAGQPLQQAALRVAGFNVLNFFNNVAGCTGGVAGAAMDCRGAGADINGAAAQASQFALEYPRQLAKTVAALARLDAAVAGLVEIENDGYGAASAQQALVDALNAATAPGRYALIDADARTGQVDAMGSDAIKVALIYQPLRVQPVGRTAALNSTAFVNGGDAAPRNRPALAQAWEQPGGARFITVANHLKSKGSACETPDAGDGQGNCNAVRLSAAQQLRSWLATDPTGTAEPDVLILGDLNAYAKEDPISAFTNAGWRDLIASYGGAQAYGYVFNGQWGYLDHALATPSLALGQVAGAVHWHISADEPSVLDYNINFKTAHLIASLYAPDAFRNSDHDPVVVALALTAPVQRRGTAGADTLLGTDADEVFTGGPGRDLLTGGGGRNQFVYTSVIDGGDTITDFRPGRDSLVLTGLLRSVAAPADAWASGHVVCAAVGADALVSVDPDGRAGAARPRPLVLLRNLVCAALNTPDNLRL